VLLQVLLLRVFQDFLLSQAFLEALRDLGLLVLQSFHRHRLSQARLFLQEDRVLQQVQGSLELQVNLWALLLQGFLEVQEDLDDLVFLLLLSVLLDHVLQDFRLFQLLQEDLVHLLLLSVLVDLQDPGGLGVLLLLYFLVVQRLQLFQGVLEVPSVLDLRALLFLQEDLGDLEVQLLRVVLELRMDLVLLLFLGVLLFLEGLFLQGSLVFRVLQVGLGSLRLLVVPIK